MKRTGRSGGRGGSAGQRQTGGGSAAPASAAAAERQRARCPAAGEGRDAPRAGPPGLREILRF